MKKKEQINIRVNKPVHLFRENLIDIESILINELSVSVLRVNFDHFEANSFSEIPESTLGVSEVKVETTNPHISIEINKSYYFIFVLEPDLKVRGAIAKIDIILNRGLELPRFYISKTITWTYLILASIALNMYVFLNLTKLAIIISIFIGLISLALYIYKMSDPLSSFVEFSTKKDTQNFFTRNKDRILIGFVIGIPIAVLSFLLGLFFNK